MNLVFSCIWALLLAHVKSAAFFNTKDILFLNDAKEWHRPFYLDQYYRNKPKLFGLVSDKRRDWSRTGYLCQAQSFTDFKANCYS